MVKKVAASARPLVMKRRAQPNASDAMYVSETLRDGQRITLDEMGAHMMKTVAHGLKRSGHPASKADVDRALAYGLSNKRTMRGIEKEVKKRLTTPKKLKRATKRLADS